MKRLKILLIILFVLGIVLNTYSQKTVQIPKDETIMYTFPDSNYCGIVTYKDYKGYSHSAFYAYVYNNDGEIIFSYTKPYGKSGSGEMITAVHPDKAHSRIILCGLQNTYKSDAFVKVFDLKSGVQKLEQTIKNDDAINLTLSPDKKHIMTGDFPVADGGNEFAIIDLETGQKLDVAEYNFPAVWYDNERIVFLKSKTIENPDYREYQEQLLQLRRMVH